MADIDWCDGFLALTKGQAKIKGEASDAGFQDTIEVISFEFGSSQGFDDDALFAEQGTANRRQTASNRLFDSGPEFGMSNLFGEESNFGSLSDADFAQFEGKDLAEVDACQFEITKQLDLSSPDLFRAYCSSHSLATREVFETGVLTLRKATGGTRQPYLVFNFNDVVVVGYTLQIDSTAFPRETVTFSFAKIKMEYKPQKDDGTLGTPIRSGWNFIDRTSM